MNYLIWIIIVVIYVSITHFVAHYIGKKRKIGYGKSVLWSVLFSPVIGFIVTILSKKREEATTTGSEP